MTAAKRRRRTRPFIDHEPLFKSFRPSFSSGMMPHPIHVLVEWVAQPSTSRHRVCKVKVFVHLFQKVAGVQRAAPAGRAPQSSKFFAVQAPLRVNFSSRKSACKRGGFCKRKAPSAHCRFAQPRKTSRGRFFCCRRINCVSGKQRSAFSAVRPGNSAAHSPAPHLPLQAPKRSSLPTGRLLLFRISRLF